MGSFIGHLGPGLIGFLYCMRTLYNVLLRYYHCEKHNNVGTGRSDDLKRYQYRSSLTYKTFCCGRLPIEEIVIILGAVFDVIAEVVSSLHYNDPFVSVGGQHITIFLFFGIAAFVSLLKHYGAPVPPDSEYACAALTFALEGFTLYNHAHSRASLDAQVHLYVVYAAYLTCLAMLCEMWFKHSLLAAISRPYFFSVQSTWLCHMAFILFPPSGDSWDWNDHTQMMLASVLFNWHFGFNIVIVGLIATVAYFQVKRKTPEQVLSYLERDYSEYRRYRRVRRDLDVEYMPMVSDEEKEVLQSK